MYRNIEISEGLFHIGVNDRRKELFENMWPLPYGVAYNSYVIVDEKCALLDTVECGSDSAYIDRVEAILAGRKLDYLIVNHMEPDHAGMIKDVISRWPDVEVVGNARTFNIMGGYVASGSVNTREVKDGEELPLGGRTLKFVLTPWVHWPETMVTYEMRDKILFSADAFGSFGTLDGGIFDDEVDFEAKYLSEMRRYYSNIVGKYCGMVQKAIKKLADVEINMICPLHGLIWRENPGKVVELYDKWSRYEADDAVIVLYASMYGNTASIADYIARKLKESGVKDVTVYDVSKTHVSYLISEMWRAKGIVLGSVSYNSDMHPMMRQVVTEIEHIGIKDRVWGLFGSYSWNGGGLRALEAFAAGAKIDVVAEAHQLQGAPSGDKLLPYDSLAEAMAQAVAK